MSTYVLMKILESAPARYDRGLRLLTCGRLDKVYDRLSENIGDGQSVLDVGCGTGALALRAARRGARVKGIDVNPQMLEIAQRRVDREGLGATVELLERGVAELGAERENAYDVVTSGLCFSELTGDEIVYALKEIRRILKPGGLLLVADEVPPENFLKRLLASLLRFPLVVITFILTQTTTHSVRNLAGRIAEAGFAVLSADSSGPGNLMAIVARNEKGRQR
jgi:ubiquinone/menaquinone biosynthesis C-methylase UbiE